MSSNSGGPALSALSHGAGTKGRLRITRLDESGHPQSEPAGRFHHTIVLVPGRNCVMMDNDLRGFLDGGFYLGWNQSDQFQVRAGRNGYGGSISSAPAGAAPQYGEHELFRFLQRWDLGALPRTADVEEVQLRMCVETPCTTPAKVVVYRVFRDWEPGRGGVYENSVSVPKPGEVWWRWARHEREAWSLPGAGHAGDPADDADTAAMPLAVADYSPGDSYLLWSDTSLTNYAAECVRSGEPMRLLFKLSDGLEDVPGIQLSFYSADYGGYQDIGRRPELQIQWSVSGLGDQIVLPVHLEAGRTHEFPLGTLPPGFHWVEFAHEEGFEPGAVAISTDGSDFRDVSQGSAGLRVEQAVRVTARVTGGVAPLDLGQAFDDELRHTWVTAGPPEDQTVEWVFKSPTGRVVKVEAVYAGAYRWEVHFLPDELGRWGFQWRHRLMKSSSEGPPGVFDVVGHDRDQLRRHLARLGEQIEGEVKDLTSAEADAARIRFSRLQRALVRTLATEGLDSGQGRAVLGELSAVRSLLWGRPMPDEIPLTSMPLLRERDGRSFADPIPFHPPPETWIQRGFRSLWRFTRRAKRRLGNPSGGESRKRVDRTVERQAGGNR